MSGIVFTNTLRRNWKQIIYWGIAFALMGFYVIAVVPDVDMLQQYADMVSNMPPLLMQAFGFKDAAQLATPEGFLGFGFFGYMLLVLAAYAVFAGLSVTTNEEDRGIMDVLLSLPIPRWRVVLERFLAYTVIIIGILAVAFAGLWGATLSTQGLNLDTGRLFEGVVNMLPATLLVLAFTVLAGTVARSRGLAVAAATIFVVASYFIDFIGSAASGTAAANLRVLSFYSWYDGSQIMYTGLQWDRVVLLIAVAAVMAAGSLWFFERRDIGL